MIDLLRYTDKPLYYIEVPYDHGQVFREYFTKIPWSQYRRIKHAIKYESVPVSELELMVFRDYVVPPGKYSDVNLEMFPAGVITTVYNAIMELSDSSTLPGEDGHVPVEELTMRVNAQRFAVSTQVDLQIMMTICAVFKGYTFEKLGELSFDKILQLFAAAERHLLNIGAIAEPLSFGRIGEEEEEKQEETKKPEPKEEMSIDDQMSIIEQHAAMQKAKAKEPPAEIEVIRFEDAAPPQAASAATAAATGVMAAKVSSKNPERAKLEELERRRVEAINKARATGQSQRSDVVQPTQSHVEANGVMTPVAPINHTGGFKAEDFENLPLLTDEEAEAFALKDGLEPAGYDIIIKQRAKTQENKQNTLAEEIKRRVGNKKITLRERKKLKAQLKKEGYLE